MNHARLTPLVLLVLCACSNGGDSPADAADAGSGDAGATDAGHTGPPAPEGQRARALKIASTTDLIPGPEAKGREGDWLIANRVARFVVQDTARPRGWLPFGGGVIDAATATGEDWFAEVALLAGFIRTVRAEHVEIVNDGSDGYAAIIRVTGRDGGIPLLDATLADVAKPSNVAVRIDYVLEPESPALEIRMTLTDTTGVARSVQVGMGIIFGDQLEFFAPGVGGEVGDLGQRGATPWLGAYREAGGASYAFWAPGAGFGGALVIDEVAVTLGETLPLEPNGSTQWKTYFVVTDRQAEGLRESLGALGAPTIGAKDASTPAPAGLGDARVSGTVTRAGSPVEALVDLEGATGAVSTVRTGADGAFRFTAPPGEYRLRAHAPGSDPSPKSAATLTSGAEATVGLALGAWGTVQLAVNGLGLDGADLGDLPVKVQLMPGEGAAAEAEPRITHLSASGVDAVPVPAGTYTAWLSHGFEFDAVTLPLEVTAGATTTLTATLPRVIDTRGWISGDFHTHMRPSIDSQIAPETRAAQAAAEGVELVLTTEHDVVSDLAPTLRAVGVERWVTSAIGSEVSPVFGHINAYPLRLEQVPQYFSIRWVIYDDAAGAFVRQMSPAEVFAELKDNFDARVVQLNHPRSSQGLLDSVGYDPERGLAALDPSVMDARFDAIEVYNSKRLEDSSETLADFYSFLNQGLNVTATGNSDSHSAGAELGFPRNFVSVPLDVPSMLDHSAVWDSVVAGRTFVSGGAFVDASVSGTSASALGALVPAPGGAVTLRVRVQAPRFVQLAKLHVVVDGAEVRVLPLADATEPLRLDADVTLDALTADAWVVFRVEGAGTTAPVVRGTTPFALSNPVYLDVDGNGTFTARGL